MDNSNNNNNHYASNHQRKIRQRPSRDALANSNSWTIARNSIIAGSCSGMMSTVVLYPMDVLRTKLQTLAGTPWQALQHTLRHGGPAALYTGMTLPLLGQAIYKGTVFSVNNVAQDWIVQAKRLECQKLHGHDDHHMKLTAADRLLCGFLGGAVNAALFVTPVEFVRNQMIAQHSARASVGAAAAATTERFFRNSWDVLWQARNQPSLLWRGVGWAVARDGLGCGLFFYTMHVMQEWLSNKEPQQQPSWSTTVMSGGVAGLAFWIVGLPLDTIKTWVQSNRTWEVRPESPWVSLQRMQYQYGTVGVIHRLQRGWQVAYGRGIPSAAITFSVYSMVYGQLSRGSSL